MMTEWGPEFTHNRLWKARRDVARILSNGTLFICLDSVLSRKGSCPAPTIASGVSRAPR